MKQLCFYRDNSYFNENDYFLMYDPTLKKLHVNLADAGDKGGTFYSKHRPAINFKYKFWYNEGPLEYKLTSIPCVNQKELIGMRVRYKNTELTGRIAEHVVLNSLGVHWDKSLTSIEYKKWGFPYFWNDPNNLGLLD